MSPTANNGLVELTSSEIDSVSGGFLILGASIYLGAVLAWAISEDIRFRRLNLQVPQG